MGLPKIIQIPCHHVLANQNSLKLKKGAPLNQIFNINLGVGILKKTTFLFVFLTYIPVFLLKFRSGELVGCGINEYPLGILLTDPAIPKTRNT